MRLLTRRIYRAFPELDRYSDEQCLRFIRTARRGFFRRAWHYSLIGAVFLVVVFGAMFPVAFVSNFVEHRTFRTTGLHWENLLTVLASIPCLGLAPLAAFIVRDWLLRRRVRYVLRTRGVCHNCRYSLVGLPVDERGMVVCPECAVESEVDKSLGELTIDQTGQARYKPSAASLPRPARIFTPPRVRKLKKAVLILLLLLGIGIPATWGGYEFWLRRQADLAQKERPGPQGLQDFVETLQPEGASTGDNAWTHFYNAQLTLELADGRVWRRGSGAAGTSQQAIPDFPLVFSHVVYSEDDDGRRKSDEASLALALKCLDAYRTDGVFDELRLLGACPRAVRDINFNASQPAVSMLLPQLGQVRQMARINSARMKLAADSHDLQDFTEATESIFALSRICRQQPLLIDQLVALAVESLGYSRVREVLAAHPDKHWLDAIDGAIARQSFDPGRTRFFEGERLSILDTTAWMFSDPAQVRRGKYSPNIMRNFNGSGEGRLGSYVENRDEISDRFAKLALIAGKDRWERPPSKDLGPPSELLLMNILMPAVSGSLKSLDKVELDRRGHRTLMALERYRLAHGEYPDSLAPLVPEFLKEVPIDPWSGKPLRYKRLAAQDEQGRDYLLYSVGKDGVDNGGLEAAGMTRYNAIMGDDASGAGLDFIVNDGGR